MLNHPNILTIYDIGTHAGAPYIISEVLEGQTLRDRLEEGPLPVRKAMDYASQIARGLAAAHEKGIVHRDLKPGNLFVNADGRVKILDFGLAKLRPRSAGEGDKLGATQDMLTNPGMVMGTVGYMSPEQVRGQEPDHRADIFAFGAILYEMFSGKRAFGRSSVGETMSAILNEEPPDLTDTTRSVPPGLERVIRRCLEKKPEERFQGAADLGFAIESISTSSGPHGPTVEGGDAKIDGRANRERVWIATTILLALALISSLLFTISKFLQAPADARAIKLFLPPPEKASFGSFAISPDGRHLAFTAATGGRERLWVRSFEALSAQTLAGTEGATFPFWSSDSRFVGFFASGKVKKIEAGGGPVQTLCDAVSAALGGTWNRDGVIVFATIGDGLSQVSASGGEMERSCFTTRRTGS